MILKEQIDSQKCPKHVAVIMDGNGRWAKQKGKSRLFGHQHGVEAVREVLEGAVEVGVKFLTLYAFSTENWNRPREEVDGLMDLMVQTIANEVDELNKNGVCLRSIGDSSGLPDSCRIGLHRAIELTKNNDRIDLILALNYSARWEIVEATKKIAEKVASGELDTKTMNVEAVANAMCLPDVPDPELLIRTSGERRISNFLLWQIAYTEFVFTDKLWPDFKRDDLFQAIVDFQNRERRFGKVSEQIK